MLFILQKRRENIQTFESMTKRACVQNLEMPVDLQKDFEWKKKNIIKSRVAMKYNGHSLTFKI